MPKEKLSESGLEARELVDVGTELLVAEVTELQEKKGEETQFDKS